MSSIRAAKPAQPDRGADAAELETSMVMLGPRDRLIGELHIEGNLRVSGTLEGQIEATGDIDVTEAATVKAAVAGREVSVSGQVSGPVVASKKLVIGRSGSIVGDVRVPRLVMQDGATLSGKVSMGPVEATSPAAAPAAKPAAQEPAAVAPLQAAETAAVTNGQGKDRDKEKEKDKAKAKRR